MEKVSIIIPVYNTEKYLTECIESALNQTYKDIEVIAVNDGSTDNSLQILEKYSDKIKIISKPNGGTASALNAGIEQMTGEWFKWLSADDVLYPNAVEDLLSYTKNLPDKKFILCSDYDNIDSEGNTINRVLDSRYNELPPFDLNVILLDHHFGNGTTSLIHKSTIDECGKFEGKFGHEDYELWLRYCLLYNCRLYFVPKSLARYRIHYSSETSSSFNKFLERNEAIRKSILDKLNPEMRKKYEFAVVKYQKSKPIVTRLVTYTRCNLLPFLPKSLSVKMVRLYWFLKSEK